MLDATPQNVIDLRNRTRERNRAVWMPMFGSTGQALDEATLNTLYLDTIEAPVAITDEVMLVKEYERDQQFNISQQQTALTLQEILDGFDFVQSKLTDLFALWQIKDRVIGLKIKSAYDLLAEVNLLLTAEKAGVDLQLTAVENEQTVQAYEKEQSQDELLSEASLKATLVAAKESLQNIQALSREEISTLRVTMELLVNAAKQWVFKNMDRTHHVDSIMSEYIGKLNT